MSTKLHCDFCGKEIAIGENKSYWKLNGTEEVYRFKLSVGGKKDGMKFKATDCCLVCMKDFFETLECTSKGNK